MLTWTHSKVIREIKTDGIHFIVVNKDKSFITFIAVGVSVTAEHVPGETFALVDGSFYSSQTIFFLLEYSNWKHCGCLY